MLRSTTEVTGSCLPKRITHRVPYACIQPAEQANIFYKEAASLKRLENRQMVDSIKCILHIQVKDDGHSLCPLTLTKKMMKFGQLSFCAPMAPTALLGLIQEAIIFENLRQRPAYR